jgi:hypothetical protein
MVNLKALVSDLKMGDYVQWNASGGKAQGKIVDIRKDGEVSSSISDYTLTGTELDPVYVIKLVQRDQNGEDILTDRTVVHRASALGVIPDPIKSVKVFQGSGIKASGNGMVKGYLVRFGNSSDTDLERDYFTKNTDFGMEFFNGSDHKLGLYYNHGMDPVVKTKKIGYGTIKMTDNGLWYEAQLDLADEYAKMIYELASKGKLGFSSGAASHMVEREKVGKSFEIKRWNLAEASLTPQPAESRNMAEAKSLKAKKEDLSVGDYVRWMAYGTEVRGQIEKIKDNGVLTGYPLGTRIVGTKEDPVYKIRVYQKQKDESYRMDSATTVHRAGALSKISKPKGYMMNMNAMNVKEYMEDMEEHEEVEEMVDGLEKVNASPEEIANSIFDGVQEDMFFDALECLTDKLRDALIAVSEYGKPGDADAVLEKFHMLALDFVNKYALPKETAEEGEEETVMMQKSVKPENIKDVERLLRDAGNLSRSQSKHLANLVWNVQRDVEPSQDPEIKTIDDKAELRRILLQKAKSFKNI